MTPKYVRSYLQSHGNEEPETSEQVKEAQKMAVCDDSMAYGWHTLDGLKVIR